MDPHSLAHINIVCYDGTYPKFKICISELFLDRYWYVPVPCIAMHCMI
jgi:hypothetical protein